MRIYLWLNTGYVKYIQSFNYNLILGVLLNIGWHDFFHLYYDTTFICDILLI